MAVARPAAFAQMLLVLVAYVVLTVAFVMQDFSVRYVDENSNSLLPLVYRYTPVWGSHEGSLRLSTLILAVWTAVVASFPRKLHDYVGASVLGRMGLLSMRFLSFRFFPHKL